MSGSLVTALQPLTDAEAVFSKRRLGHLRRKLSVIPVVVTSFSEVPEVLGSL
jgi:hypothetical protein